jgi:hypothetical protein
VCARHQRHPVRQKRVPLFFLFHFNLISLI